MKIFTRIMVCALALSLLTAALAGCGKKAEEGGGAKTDTAAKK
jgi:hypothetical protein